MSETHKVIFYPVGNGDTSQIILANGRRVLCDFRHLACADDEDRPEINLAARYGRQFQERTYRGFEARGHASDWTAGAR